LRKGIVVNVEEAASAIESCIQEAERMAGHPCKSAFVGVAGGHISSLNSKGVIAVSRADGEIAPEDVERAIDAAQAVSLPSNREILHVLPRNFIIDGQEGIKDPVGMSGVRLEVEAHIVTGATASLRNLVKCVNAVGVDVDGIALSPIASAQSVLTDTDKEIGCIVVDIGGGTTDVAVYTEGSIWHTTILPIGGSHITNDLAIGLRIPFDVAERLKVEGYTHEFDKTDEINLQEYGADEEQIVSRQILYEIVSSRAEEIFMLVASKVRKSGYTGRLPGGVILTGGAAQMPGMVDFSKHYLQLPTRIGIPMKIAGFVEKVKSPAFATTAGLLLWGQHNQYSEKRGNSKGYNWNALLGQFKDWIKRSFSL
jgi:cell division protein FtsA